MKKNIWYYAIGIKFPGAVKFLLKMKLTLSIILFSLLGAIASELDSQTTKLNLNLKNASVMDVLGAIEDQSDFFFLYSEGIFDKNNQVNIELQETTIDKVLDQIFSGSDINYVVKDFQINLASNIANSSNSATSVTQQSKSISGRITDSARSPLPGVSVVIKGTTTGTISDLNGSFNLTNVPENATLQFSFIGMQKQEILVAGKKMIDVVMLEETFGIDEVVAVGYGTMKKSDLTGSVASVDTKKLENLSAPRVDQLLQGRAAGVHVTSVNGSPNARTTIRIRGGNSINADNEPLYVIDGFIVGTGYNLSNLNVNDIKSIDILKDATAISIYGTRGANGVIMITTKSGENLAIGKPKVDLNVSTGISKMVRKIDYLNGPERAKFGSEAAILLKESNPWADPNEIIADTDWQDLISQTANSYNLGLSITGRNENLNYYVSFNHLDQEGIIRESGVKRYNLRSNFDLKISEKVKLGLRLNTSFINSDNDKVDFWGMREVLTAFPVYNTDGSFNTENIVTGGVLNNPEAVLQQTTNFTYNTNILANGYIEFEVLKGLTLRSSIGPNIDWSKRNEYYDSTLPLRASSKTGGNARITSIFDWNILQENTLSFNKTFTEDHKLDIVAGFTWQKGHGELFQGSTSGIAIDALKYHNLSLGSQETFDLNSGFRDARQMVSWIGRTNYIYRNKYLFTVVGRIDGSSVYSGAKNTYAFFPSASAAWRMNEEQFIKDLNVFSNLKLKFSYGSAGKESIAPYRTLSVLSGGTVIFNDSQEVSMSKGRPSNIDLKWETTKPLDLGLEMGFFENRLIVETNYYYKKTTDLLLEKRIPQMTGFSTKLENVGSIQNQGIELLINSVNVSKKNFNWSSTLTLSGNRSKVLDLGSVESIILHDLGGAVVQLIKDKPVGVFTGVEYLGTYKNQEEIDADGPYGLRQMIGGPRYKDTDGSGIINNDDHEIIGNPEPLFYGGLNNTLIVKNFQLDVYLQGTYGNDILNEYSQPGFFGRTTENVYAELINRWTPENPTSNIPRAGTMASYTDVRASTALIEDGSHLRLKSVKLSYTIPTSKVGIHWLQNLNVYITGTNLALLSKFRGYDPEVNRFGTDAVLRGVARAEYPNSRTFNFGLQANF